MTAEMAETTIPLDLSNITAAQPPEPEETTPVPLRIWQSLQDRLAQLEADRHVLQNQIDVLLVSAKLDGLEDLATKYAEIADAKTERLRDRIAKLEDDYDAERQASRALRADLEFQTSLQKLTRDEVNMKQAEIDRLSKDPDVRSEREQELLLKLGQAGEQISDLHARLRTANNAIDAGNKEQARLLGLPPDVLEMNRLRYAAAIQAGNRQYVPLPPVAGEPSLAALPASSSEPSE